MENNLIYKQQTDEGARLLCDDLHSLYSEAYDYEFHDFKNTKYYNAQHRGRTHVVYRSLMGYTFVFGTKRETEVILITVHKR